MISPKTLKNTLDIHKGLFISNLICKENAFLDHFRMTSCVILQPDEIKQILNRPTKRTQNSFFLECIYEKLGQSEIDGKAVLSLMTALKYTGQEDLLNVLINQGHTLKAEQCESLFKSQTVKHSQPEILKKYHNMKVYRMSEDKRGYCLIINITNFTAGGHEKREGSDKDVQNLKRVFTDLGFSVDHNEDLTAQGIKDRVNAMVSMLSESENDKYGMIVLVLMSHGHRNGTFYGSDGMPIDRYDLYRTVFKSEALKGKPKFFVVQACAGGAPTFLDNSVFPSPDASPEPALEPEDTLIINSSFEGFTSNRYPGYGTVLIIALTQILAEFSCKVDLEKICKMVQQKIRDWNIHFHNVPCYFSFLPKKLYLLPGLKDIDGTEPLANYLLPFTNAKVQPYQAKLKIFPERKQVYPMYQKRGRCLIFNIMGDAKSSTEGSEQDACDLKRVFEKLDFEVSEFKKDLTGKKITEAVEHELVKDYQNYGMFVMILLAQGSGLLNIGDLDQHELRMQLNDCETLKNKPKFIISDGDHKKDNLGCWSSQIGSVEDFLILDSTLDGGRRQMLKQDRSLFVRILVYLLYNHSHEWHLEKICKKLQDEMRKHHKKENKKKEKENKNEAPIQIPCYVSFLRRKLFLFPGLNAKEITAVCGTSDKSGIAAAYKQAVDEDEDENSTIETGAKLKQDGFGRNGVDELGIEGELYSSGNEGHGGSENEQLVKC